MLGDFENFEAGLPLSLLSMPREASIRDIFDGCSLIEIVHFHECLRGELRSLYANVRYLLKQALDSNQSGIGLDEEHFKLEFQVMSQFQLLWAVFQSHSTAEDEIIWPALKAKARKSDNIQMHGTELFNVANEQEYTEEHSQENALFQSMDELLSELRATRRQPQHRVEILGKLELKTFSTFMHLLTHLEKEETSALPLIKKYFSPIEVEVLVGKIMGKRPSELMSTILGMMIKNLNPDDVGSMMGCMKQAVKDTYFEKWLDSGGFSWDGLQQQTEVNIKKRELPDDSPLEKSHDCSLGMEFRHLGILSCGNETDTNKEDSCPMCFILEHRPKDTAPLSESEFQAAVRKIGKLKGVSTSHKTALIQALRNYMYSSAKRSRCSHQSGTIPLIFESTHDSERTDDVANVSAVCTDKVEREQNTPGHTRKRLTLGINLMPPKHFYTNLQNEESCFELNAPLFPFSELESTWQQAPLDGKSGVMGCPHYQRYTKLRAACCGHLFTCRLCHDQVMDHTMDRYQVCEMYCMLCGALQPVSNKCRHESCPSRNYAATEDRYRDNAGNPLKKNADGSLSKYYCSICHLHDDNSSKDIYHCPYCNICRLGKGLGIDFCHCMKCNACITIATQDSHRCVSHSLGGQCPICSTGMFESTQQVKGLKCGHFMHLHCYKEYVRNAEQSGHWYRCPICLRSMDDMTEYFGQLDAVVASQPMPIEFVECRTKVLCHDCEDFSTIPYHFCFLKCGGCGSYNTRVEELLRPTPN